MAKRKPWGFKLLKSSDRSSGRRNGAVFIALVVLSVKALAFDYFEHRAIGNEAFRIAYGQIPDELKGDLNSALDELGIKGNVGAGEHREAGPRPDFGDATAVAGDLASDVDDLSKLLRAWGKGGGNHAYAGRAKKIERASNVQLDNVCRWIRAMNSQGGASDFSKRLDPNDNSTCLVVLQGAKGAQKKWRYAEIGYLSPRYESAAFEAIPGYVSLASDNKPHFPAYSWQAYAELHLMAMAYARCHVSLEGNCLLPIQNKSDALRLALIHEAMAQHFLQDSFASGHIGTYFDTTKSSLQQTHDFLNSAGLDVHIRNPLPCVYDESKPLEWTAFGDRSLFITDAQYHRWIVNTAAAHSLSEVLKSAVSSSSVGQCTAFPAKIADPRALSDDELRQTMMGLAAFLPLPPKEQQSTFARMLDGDSNLKPSVASLVDLKTDTTPIISLFSPERSKDERVPDIPNEGWRFGVGWALRKVSDANYVRSTANGSYFTLDYVRPIDSAWNRPDVYGIEQWVFPSRGETTAGSVGWFINSKHAPCRVATRLRFASTVDDYEAKDSKYLVQDRFISTSAFLEASCNIYGPVALFFRTEVLGYTLNKHRFYSLGKSPYEFSILGIQLSLAGI